RPRSSPAGRRKRRPRRPHRARPERHTPPPPRGQRRAERSENAWAEGLNGPPKIGGAPESGKEKCRTASGASEVPLRLRDHVVEPAHGALRARLGHVPARLDGGGERLGVAAGAEGEVGPPREGLPLDVCGLVRI